MEITRKLQGYVSPSPYIIHVTDIGAFPLHNTINMSDLDKIIHIASAARGAYNTFSEAVGEEGEVIRDGRKIR